MADIKDTKKPSILKKALEAGEAYLENMIFKSKVEIFISPPAGRASTQFEHRFISTLFI